MKYSRRVILLAHLFLESIRQFNQILLKPELGDSLLSEAENEINRPQKLPILSYLTRNISPVEGVLCLRTTIAGSETCRINGKTVVIRPDKPLLINADEPYSILSGADEASCTFWGKKAINQVFLAHSIPIEKAIDADWKSFSGNIHFNNHLDCGLDIINYILRKIEREAFKHPHSDSDYIEEMLFILLKTIFLAQNNLSDEIGDIRSVRAPHRLEILKRIHFCKSYINSNFTEKIDIDQIAEISGFSKYHFIRLFKEVYKITPRQYIINKRCELAGKLLATTRRDILDIALEIGLESPSHFVQMFKSVYSITPGEFRRNSSSIYWKNNIPQPE